MADNMINKIIHGDAFTILKTIPDESVNCCVTSPPYWNLRNYNILGQLGLEKTPNEYVTKMTEIFHEVKRVLRKDGTLWLNLGDSYANDGKWGGSTGGKHVNKLHGNTGIGRRRTVTNLKPKSLIGVPWRVAFALQTDAWVLRQDIIWSKPNPMPESVRDRCTKAHEYIFMLSKSERYYYNYEAIKESGVTKGEQGALMRNKRSVWTIATKSFKEAHFATFPPDLIRPCILAGCPKGGTVLDPFMGAGTTALVALETDRKFIGIELNRKYIKMSEKRIRAHLSSKMITF